MEIKKSLTTYDLKTGTLSGEETSHAAKRLSDVAGIFGDQAVAAAMDPNTIVYEVDSHMAVQEGTPGGLFFGTSRIHPGKVGNEYFMTKGHFHSRRETAEYYWGISGTGVLLLMDETGNAWSEQVEPGSLHYIGGHIAHRLVNTGEEDLIVGACWPSDAGHDYGSIERSGFPIRVVCRDGKAVLEENKA
ncbi:MAG: glucose-6-phosphate isomerase [Acutalibacter sp.]|nr:glucose-6-phosphate isomerase [Acutalibacter sp.]